MEYYPAIEGMSNCTFFFQIVHLKWSNVFSFFYCDLIHCPRIHHLKLYSSVVLLYSQCFAKSETSKSKIFSSAPIPHTKLPIAPTWPIQQQLIYFLSLKMCLFWTVHINRIIQYVTFYIWLLSLSVMFLRYMHACSMY